MNIRKIRRGQTFTHDFFLSTIVFIFIINICYFAFNSAQDKSSSFESDLMQKKVFYITDMLVRTPGYPPYDWNETNVELIGLADSSNVLDNDKLDMLGNISYDNLTYIWGLAYYDFNLTIEGNSTYYTFGKDIKMNATFITPFERIVLVETDDNTTEKGILKYTLWTK